MTHEFIQFLVESFWRINNKKLPIYYGFDFSIIEKYGWYSPSNKRNNLGGVSRDHIYSVMEGFKNNIDSKILSHPANCQLMIHNDNISKGNKSSITLEELLEKIKEWDKKYGGLV